MLDLRILHLAIMGLGAIFYLVTSCVGFFDKGDKKINLHVGLGTITGILFIIGIFHLIMAQAVYPFFTHFYFAFSFFVILLISLILGIIYKNSKIKNKILIRRLHKSITLIGLVVLIVTIILGVRVV
ncbi:MAG: hypothetical protein N2Z64_07770 [Dictyoglomus thermophilum]|uniref:Cytochrome b561 domain-containing protein n=1 Tax=Dictyoglomus thermophilum TaxID=14 RepID=A0A7V4DXD6_DICTH|nr:hypothetical protein [Dictyoglomus thermophilum]MCX7721161.1 hypothetical protein [Dictyoglomus thermophilum]TYT21076.1 hypothetical protein FY122_08790 [Dictyoglomus thermophilum]